MPMPSNPGVAPRLRALILLLSIAFLTTGCEIWRGGVSATPLTRTAEQPEEGWVYAQGGDVRAACPTQWTLELSEHHTRAWRCRYPDTTAGTFTCGLTIYPKRGAKDLDQLVQIFQPDIEAYGDESELLSSQRASLGGEPSQLFILDQTFDETQTRGFYHLAFRPEGAWLAHCLIPREQADADRAIVDEIFERIEL